MKQHKLFWGSSYDRGLQYLLYMWTDIKNAIPDAELHICYGWDMFLKVASGNPERMQWKQSMDALMQQDGIVHHGRVGKKKLAKVRKQCGIWAYPTDFKEINCITALDCQKSGTVPIVIDLAALSETVEHGIKIKGDIKDKEVQGEYLNELLTLMSNKEKWQELSKKGKKWAKDYYWDKIAIKWVDEFKKPVSDPMVSIITPTIREGWWRIMAENLSRQTHKNFEWIIIDDHKDDRQAMADKYMEIYQIDIKYIRGDKVTGKYKRKIGLVRANNQAWKASSGELLVWLQDFIIIPNNGLEMLVDLYRHNPDALIAPVDIYYNAKKANTENKEDWWDKGMVEYEDFLLEETWRNIRVINQGIRETDNPYDLEMNYSAIPKKILDELNGFWEFMDDGLGFDNTEIAMRAMKLGYRLIIDDANIAKCINLWPVIGGTPQNISNRERILNTPRYKWLVNNTNSGKLPIKRDEVIDAGVSLPFEVPKEVENKDCAKWINVNANKIMKGWV